MRRLGLLSFRGRRGTAQLALLLAAGAVVAGMTLGSGVAAKQARSGYDMAWLPDGTRGQLVQVDPVLGRANVRLQVASPGSQLSIQQGNGKLVVLDRKTGKITSIDLGTLLVGGTRSERPGDGVKVLLAGDRLYVADLKRGTVRAVDPATQADVGTPWSAGRPLVDIGVDGAHDVWALDSGQHLVRLQWRGNTLTPLITRTVQGAGVGSVIVGHDRGITLVGSQGAIVRVGTGHDTRLDAPHISGPLHGPQHSPDGLVPVSDPGSSSVVIVGPRDAVVDDVSGYGCEQPGTPTVFDDKVYVPCLSAHKVIVLDAGGSQVGSAIPTPGAGDPQLTVSGGRLVIDVPGTGRATVVDPSGKTRGFPTVAPGIGVQDPNKAPPNPPDPPKNEPSKQHEGHNQHHSSDGRPDGGGGGLPGNSGSSGPGAGTDAPATPGADESGSASAQARPDGTVLVSWTRAGSGDTVVTATSTGGEVATVPAGGMSATVTVLDPGTSTAFHVRNTALDATTNSVTTAAVPGAVTGVNVTSQGVSNGKATLAVTWTAAPGNGAPVSYTVGAGTSATKTTDSLNATVTAPCAAAAGCSGTVTVTPRNSSGSGTAGSGPYSVAPVSRPNPQPNPQPQPTSIAPQPEPTTVPAPIAMPAGGEALIQDPIAQTTGSVDSGNPAVATVTVNAPSDWAAFAGSCALWSNGVAVDTVPCSASGWQKSYEYYASGPHEFFVRASDSGRDVDSAHVSVTVTVRKSICLNSAGERQLAGGPGIAQRPVNCDNYPGCPNCQIPFKQQTGLDARTEPSAVPDRRSVRPTLGRWFE